MRTRSGSFATGLRVVVHVLVVALTLWVLVAAVTNPRATSVEATVAAIVFGAVYGVGVALQAHVEPSGRLGRIWLTALCLAWIALVWWSAEAAYLAFPLFFLFIIMLPGLPGAGAVVCGTILLTAVVIERQGFTLGGVAGPIVGGAVVLLVGTATASLARESAERERLLGELVNTRDQLAASEREAGVLAERTRLAGEIHDTVAQSLSSVVMLLHAAEADVAAQGQASHTDQDALTAHLRLARETAQSGLADARRFVRELTPVEVAQGGLPDALRRLALAHERTYGTRVTALLPERLLLPMAAEAALLRVAQSALANVAQHANASTVTLRLDADADAVRLSVHDDGVGFDPATMRAESGRDGASGSFGLPLASERVARQGGLLEVDSAPGRGTVLTVTLPVAVPA